MPVPGFWGFAWYLLHFQLLHPLPIYDWHPSSCCHSLESQNGWVCVCFKTVWALQVEFPENLAVSSAVPLPTAFYSQKLWGFIFQALEPQAVQSSLGLGLLDPKVSFLIFIHHMIMWDHLCLFCCHHCLSVQYHVSLPLHPISISLPILPIWMNVASLNPWLQDFHTAQCSDGSG